jgi:hypothetical protein
MEINKDLLIKICILLIIIILLSFLYIRLTDNIITTTTTSKNNINKQNTKNKTNNNVENFEVNDGNAIDLLSKLKYNAIIPLDPNNLSNTVIKPWTTKIYNMQSGNQQVKPLALYQPQLLIKSIQYCKLGDMLCQNTDYSPPNSSHFTLLIKKGSSDIKPPINYDLIVNFGEENVNINYYDYESYITSAASQAEIMSILPNIINCSKIFSNINSLIQTNLDTLEANLSTQITKNIKIEANKKPYNILGLINTNKPINVPIIENSFKFPAGLSGTLISNQFVSGKGFNNSNPINIPFNIPSTIDSLQIDDKGQIASYVPSPFQNIDANNITIENYTFPLITLLPINSIITLIESLCNDINTIYNKHINNTKFLLYLKLVDDVHKIQTFLNSIDNFNNFLSQYDNINTITISTNPEIQSYVDTILQFDFGNSIIGQTLNLLKSNSFAINYKLTYVSFTEANIDYPVVSTKQNFVDIPEGKSSSNTTDVIEPFYDWLGIGNAFTVGFKDNVYEKGLRDGFYNTGLRDTIYEAGLKNGFYETGLRDNVYEKGLKYSGNTVGCFLSGGTATSACRDGAQGRGGGDEVSSATKLTVVGDNYSDGTPITFQLINNLQMTSFTNNFVLNLPKNALNINLNPAFSSIIKSSMKNLTDFTIFLNDLQNNTIKNLPLKIYKPIPPKGYLSLGHIFCNLQNQLDDIKISDVAGNGTCCVPENCVKEMRDWNISDKMFEYNKNGTYWAIYYNPYTGTFISTNTNNFPDGKVCKVVACVKKCTAIDDLQKADDCIRNYYNMNKTHSVKLAPDLVSDTEEEYYLNKVKTQSDTITKLYKRANGMQLDMDKATIVTAEMNKNKLQKYVDTQKRNIDIVTQRLIDDDDKIQTNVNIPLDVLNNILNMIKNNKKLSPQQKDDLTNKLLDNKKLADANLITKGDYDNNLNKILSNCPDYDLTGLVKKEIVSSVCYGCTA